MNADNDLWYVKTADGDVDRMTLDDLDEAFNAGRVDESATVLPAGASTWVRLGALLGLDAPADAPAPVPVATAPAPVAFAALPSSIRPLSLDLADDEPPPFARKSRKGAVVGAMVGALAVAGVVFGATRSMHHEDATTAAAAIAAPPPVTAAPSPPPPAAPEPVTAPAPPTEARFSEEQRARLVAADRSREDKAKAIKKERAAGASRHHSNKYKSQGFTSGGSKFDPLNAGL